LTKGKELYWLQISAQGQVLNSAPVPSDHLAEADQVSNYDWKDKWIEQIIPRMGKMAHLLFPGEAKG
jgi:hypothetical protein